MSYVLVSPFLAPRPCTLSGICLREQPGKAKGRGDSCQAVGGQSVNVAWRLPMCYCCRGNRYGSRLQELMVQPRRQTYDYAEWDDKKGAKVRVSRQVWMVWLWASHLVSALTFVRQWWWQWWSCLSNGLLWGPNEVLDVKVFYLLWGSPQGTMWHRWAQGGNGTPKPQAKEPCIGDTGKSMQSSYKRGLQRRKRGQEILILRDLNTYLLALATKRQ